VNNLKIKTDIVTVDGKQYDGLYVKPVTGSLFYDDETGEIFVSENESELNKIAVNKLALNLSLNCDEVEFKYVAKHDKENV
jgi:hypothetical protein